METVIGVIVTVTFLVFKVIEKKMKDSAKRTAPQQEGAPDWEEILSQELVREKQQVPEPMPVQPQPEQNLKPEQKPKPKSEPKPQERQQKIEPTPMADSVKETPKKEKVDPKKLVIYSEIMNRKY